MQIQELDKPWNLLPPEVKQWARDNGYIIRESNNGSGATYYGNLKDDYIKQLKQDDILKGEKI